VSALAADTNIARQNIDMLDWETVAEKFGPKESFCATKNKDENSINYALNPNVSTITLPSNVKLPKEKVKAELRLSKWQENQWSDLPSLTVQVDPNGLITGINTIADGFYNLSLISDRTDFGKNNFYAVVTADWKKDLFTWCRKNKEQIEINPDPRFVYSSIVVSHIDNLMELAGKSPVLSKDIPSALSEVVKAKTDFKAGGCPDLVMGLNKIRLKRFEGASVAEFAIRLPKTYEKSKKWPMLVYADSRRAGAENNYNESSGIIILWWHFPAPLGYEWKDYKYFLDVIRDKINLDKDRIYINGDCSNGIASVDLGLKYPDQWAECSASLGNASRQLAGNAFNLPLIFVKGGHNEDFLVSYYDFAVESFKYRCCTLFQHSKDRGIADVRGKSVPDAVRNLSPYRVSYTIESLANPSAYWLQIDGREDENFIASMDAIVWGQSILIKTKNIDAYTLNLGLAPVDCNRPVEIIENDKHLNPVIGPAFVKKGPKYETALYVKNELLHGPVSDVFTDSYAVVWKGDENAKKFAGQVAGSAPCFADAEFPADFIKTHNIVFVGEINKSKYFSPIISRLPVTIEDGKLTANGKVYEGDFGVFFIYPNLLNPQKYIAVFSVVTEKARDMLNTAWEQIKSKSNADIGIFQVGENDKIEWRICEKFNTVWSWHPDWDTPLARLDKTHPKWKWHQWVARALKKQLKADVMILEDPFISAATPVSGELTLRDISRNFVNDWLVKVRLKGCDLKELLMVPFNDISSREVSAPVIDGVSLVKQSADSDVIFINELQSDRFYTVAFSYKAVNGKRMGMVLKNYRLEDEGFLVVLLKEYLAKNTTIDMDAELDGVHLNIF
jgi:hypothetical protein